MMKVVMTGALWARGGLIWSRTWTNIIARRIDICARVRVFRKAEGHTRMDTHWPAQRDTFHGSSAASYQQQSAISPLAGCSPRSRMFPLWRDGAEGKGTLINESWTLLPCTQKPQRVSSAHVNVTLLFFFLPLLNFQSGIKKWFCGLLLTWFWSDWLIVPTTFVNWKPKTDCSEDKFSPSGRCPKYLLNYLIMIWLKRLYSLTTQTLAAVDSRCWPYNDMFHCFS